MKLKMKFAPAAALMMTLVWGGLSSCRQSQESAEGQPDTPVPPIVSLSMNTICKEWDGQWQGITVASDGNCYFSSSTHSKSHGAGFHRFDPRTNRHTVLAEDMTEVCGEGATLSQQGKIHSPIVEADGWLYFTTHLSNYWTEGIERYTGAHVVGYELATGRFRDLGIVRPRYSIYSAIDVDPVRKKLYVFVVPFLPELFETDGCHLYSVDIASGRAEDLGRLTHGEKGASFWFFVDRLGNVWFTLWKLHWLYDDDPGNLYVYRPDAGKIETYRDVLPRGRTADGTPVTDEKQLRQRSWTWAQALPGREKCLFAMGAWGGGDERLWLFDPSQDIASGAAFTEVAAIGSTFLQTALGGDRVYFAQFEDPADERTFDSETYRELDPSAEGFTEKYLHLRSVAIGPEADRKVKDHGRIVDQDGRAARMIMSLTADGQGRVYMYGSWHVKTFKEATMQYLLFEHPNGDLYRLQKRGEFFAVARTAER
ncbi:MAG: hypothetical protein H6P98_3034 [Candidatus Aminicenantes bacterium]|nr:hypothetical protein [Candidatus Aminicenantes bacterium]